MMLSVLFIFTLILAIAYAAFLLWCLSGWLKLPVYHTPVGAEGFVTFVTVIIPARNEEENIFKCLSDFQHQDYPPDLFEVIVVDDHSTDRTASVAEKFIVDFPSVNVQLVKLEDEGEKGNYKKQAITEGIRISKGSLVITTDADCRRGNAWIKTLAGYAEKHSPGMISAPVIFENEKTWLEKIQSLEFLGLIAIGASAIKNQRPFLCNGANLAFSRKVFNEVGGYKSAKNFASGDDTQLMIKVASADPGRIHFIKSGSATVRTVAQKTLIELLRQRKRWASKIPLQMNSFTVLIATIAYFLHAGLVFLFFYSLYAGNLYCFLIPFMIKVFPEFLLLAGVTRFFEKSYLLFLFLPAQLIYPFYISYVGLASLSRTYQWKGRKVK